MYRLSRVLSDGQRRPISAGMSAREGDTVCCEVLEGETVVIDLLTSTGKTLLVSEVGLDPKGQVVILGSGTLTQYVLNVLDDKPLMLGICHGDNAWVAHLRYIDDVRLFVQVFPRTYTPEDASRPGEIGIASA